MSEPAPDYNPNVEDEETDQESPPEGDDTGEETPPATDPKAERALKRMKAERDRARSELAELRRQAQQGDPNKGEMEKLTEQVAQLQRGIDTSRRVTSLLEAGFNQGADKAERMLRLVDSFDDPEWIEELKVDYPERFGRRSRQPQDRPFTGGGRDRGDAPPKDPNQRHVDAMLKAAARNR